MCVQHLQKAALNYSLSLADLLFLFSLFFTFPYLPNFLSLSTTFTFCLLMRVLNSPRLRLLSPFFVFTVCSFFSSLLLSVLRHVSAISPLHLLIPVRIQPSTHTHTQLPLLGVLTHTHACRLRWSPRGCEEPGVSAHSHQLTVQENALCKRTGSINLPAGSARSLMLFAFLRPACACTLFQSP